MPGRKQTRKHKREQFQGAKRTTSRLESNYRVREENDGDTHGEGEKLEPESERSSGLVLPPHTEGEGSEFPIRASVAFLCVGKWIGINKTRGGKKWIYLRVI